VSLPRATAAGHWKDKRHIGRIDLLVAGNADRPVQAALTERVAKRRAQAIPGISQYATKPRAASPDPVDFVDRDLRLAAESLPVSGNPRLLHSDRIARPALRQE
jgi:hypothetical protein